MAFINENFDDPSSLSAWSFDVSGAYPRNWTVANSLLSPDDAVAYQPGLITYIGTTDSNGKLYVGYDGIVPDRAQSDSGVAFRYVDSLNFTALAINPGTTDIRGASIFFNNIGSTDDYNMDLYNIHGIPLSDEVYNGIDYYTTIPSTGVVSLKFDDNRYEVEMYDSSGAYLASGVYIDDVTRPILSGTFGFIQSDNWDRNINGWDWISLSGTSGTPLNPPTILSYDAIPDVINTGDSSTLSWDVYDGADPATQITISNGVGSVSATGSYVVSPIADTTYVLSAYNVDGSDSRSVTVSVVSEHLSTYIDTSTNYVCSGTPYDVIWGTTGATSAFIDNGIGWVMSAGAVSGTISNILSPTTIYSITAFSPSDAITDNTFITVYDSVPVADAGPVIQEEVVDVDAHVTVNGGMSYDPDGRNLTYTWYVDGVVVSGNSSSLLNLVLSGGSYRVDMDVTNGCGVSATDDTYVFITQHHSPVSDITITPQFINIVPYTVHLDSSGSHDIDGSIVSYQWKYDGHIVSNQPEYDISVDSYGVHTVELKVTDDDGFVGTSTDVVIATELFNPSANAGPDVHLCIGAHQTSADVVLNGSGSLPEYDASALYNIVWYNWNLMDMGLNDVSGVVSGSDDLIITVPSVPYGDYTVGLTVSADSSIIDIDYADVHINRAPTISAYSTDMVTGGTAADVQLNGYTNSNNAVYDWVVHVHGQSDINLVGHSPVVLSAPVGNHSADLVVKDVVTGCVSETKTTTFTVSNNAINIVDFSLSPDYVVGYHGNVVPVDATWEVVGVNGFNVAHVEIGGVPTIPTGDINQGTYSMSLPSGSYTYTLSAYNTPSDLVTKTIRGEYETTHTSAGPADIIICKEKDKYIKTYGVDEVRYGTNRDLNLTNYLSEYISDTSTSKLLYKFECYLNNMFDGQANYSLSENLLALDACSTSSCSLSAINNTYHYNTSGIMTPTYRPVGDVFINDICKIPNDDVCDVPGKISILDKIFRLTDMFDPDLIPIELIQFYAENLGYSVGINRESMAYSSTDPRAIEFEQKRYLRFMVRNLPTWYQIKTNRASVKIMLYSFGIVGSFVYYYTKNYCDGSGKGSSKYSALDYNCLGQNTSIISSGDTSGASESTCYDVVYDDIDVDDVTSEDIEKLRCCASDVINNSDLFDDLVGKISHDDSKDWVLTRNDPSSVFEDIKNSNIPDDYFASPHFRLWVDILSSDGNYSVDKKKQQMIYEAVMAVKPINTVFDGVSVYFDAGVCDVYVMSYVRVRKTVKVFTNC